MAEQFLNQTGGKAATEFQESLATLQSYNLPCSETKEKIKTLKKSSLLTIWLRRIAWHPRKGCDNAG